MPFMGSVVRVFVVALWVRKVSGEREMMAWRVGPSSKTEYEPMVGLVWSKRCRARDLDEPVKGRVMGWVRLTW